MNSKDRIFVESFHNAEELKQRFVEAFTWIGLDNVIKNNDQIFIKPNLTYPFHKKGVTTSPELIEVLVSILREKTSKISIVESDGGSHAWKAEEAFEGHGLYDVAKKYDVKLLNLSPLPAEYAETTIVGRKVGLELPSILLHEADVFITIPVPKVHVITGVTLAFKNQWGCIPDAMRIRHHPEFDHKVVVINKLLKPKLAIFDGEYFLNRSGPMDGDAVKKDLLIVSDDIGAGSLACCELMRIDWRKIRHLKIGHEEGMFPSSLSECFVNQDLSTFKTEKFYLKRNTQNQTALWAFHSRFGTNLFYLWPTATILHKILYAIKGKPKDFTPSYWRTL